MPTESPVKPTVSPTELAVLQLVAEGQKNHLIGAALGLSPLTVKTHLANIGRKLGTGNRAGMVGVAFRRGLIR